MRIKRVVIIATWLLVSALMTLVVAWSLQLRAQERVRPSFRALKSSDYGHWYALRKPHWPADPGTATEERSVGYLRFEVRGHNHPAHSTDDWAHYKLFTTCVGWPFLCLRSDAWRVWGSHPDAQGAPDERGFYELPAFFQSPLKRPRRVSVLPVWWALLLNFIVFAGCIAGLWHCIPAWRRAKRFTKGLCWRCGYPFGSGLVCTECGTPRKRSGHIDVALEKLHVGIAYLRTREWLGLTAIASLVVFGICWRMIAHGSTQGSIPLEVQLGLLGAFVAAGLALSGLSCLRKRWISTVLALASIAIMIWLARATLALYASL